MNITLEIPEKVLEKLKQKALSEEDKTLEEIGLEILLDWAGLKDPETGREVHLGLSEKYLHEGEELSAKRDWVQASEKAWGAASQMVKAVAAKRGIRLKSHSELNEYVDKLYEETGDIEINRFWRSALSLHQNFYESWLSPGLVKGGIEDVKMLIEKLTAL